MEFQGRIQDIDNGRSGVAIYGGNGFSFGPEYTTTPVGNVNSGREGVVFGDPEFGDQAVREAGQRTAGFKAFGVALQPGQVRADLHAEVEDRVGGLRISRHHREEEEKRETEYLFHLCVVIRHNVR